MVAHGRRAFEGPRSHLSLVTKDYERSANVRVLDPEDVAESVLYALRQPEHAAVNEVLVQPRDEPV
jgi:NADP-dependent 3-hydroxy acid dehydrogenase YdfG